MKSLNHHPKAVFERLTGPMPEAYISIPVLQAVASLGTGSSWQRQERGSKAASSKPAHYFQPCFQWCHMMGQHQEDKLLFSLLCLFVFQNTLEALHN